MTPELYKAAEKIRDAIHNPGPHPAYHVAQLHRLHELIEALNQQENDQ